MGRTLPITSVSMPTTLVGKQNGMLPDHILTTIGVGSARMEVTAARSFVAMFAEARRVLGVTLKHVGDYRPYGVQLSMFLDRYEPVSFVVYAVTAPSNRKKWATGVPSQWWRKKKRGDGSYPATAATPGASNHGWGLALDIAEEYDNDPSPDPIRDRFVQWLCDNASRYGISAELQSEAWHWRYFAGDRIPQATLDYERSQGILGGNAGNSTAPAVTGPALVYSYPGVPLVLGSQGESVKLVQAVVGAKPDGDYGPATERRVKVWQSSKGLKADGIVGAVTWKRMFG
jgi:hypothetical protein